MSCLRSNRPDQAEPENTDILQFSESFVLPPLVSTGGEQSALVVDCNFQRQDT